MGDILFHQVESLGHQVVEFLLAWRSCTTLNAILYWIRIILKFLKICGTKKRSIWHPGFSTAVFKQVAKSQGGDWWMIILDSSDSDRWVRDPAINLHHIMAPRFLSWNVSHWNFEIQFMVEDRQVTSPTRFTVNPDLPPLGQSLSLPNGSNPSKRHWWVWRGERWQFLERLDGNVGTGYSSRPKKNASPEWRSNFSVAIYSP